MATLFNPSIQTLWARTPEEKFSLTMKMIREKIQAGGVSPKVRAIALEAVKTAPEFSDLGQVVALVRWIRARVTYRRDPIGAEVIADPRDTLKIGFGDCDDLVVLFGSLAQSIGFQVNVKSFGRDRNGLPSHVYALVKVTTSAGRGMLPVDLARPDGRFFSRPEDYSPTGGRVAVPPNYNPSVTPNTAAVAGVGSWLSAATDQVLGKDLSGKLQANTKAATSAFLSVVPGGSFVKPLVDELSNYGADPKKMSWASIQQLATSDPARAAEIAAEKRAWEASKARKHGRQVAFKAAKQQATLTGLAAGKTTSSSTALLAAAGLGALLLLKPF